MRKLAAIIAIAFALCCPSWATWTTVQTAISGTCVATSSACAVTVSSTGTGNVIAVGMSINSNAESIVSVSGGGTYSHPAGCHGTDGTTRGTDCAYTLSSTSGTTSISISRTDATNFQWRCWVVEFSFTIGPVSLDSGSPVTRDQTTTTTTPAGATLTPAGTNDALVQIIEGASPTSQGGYDTAKFSGNFAFAAKVNSLSAGITWTQSNGTAALSAIGFTESSAPVTGFSKRNKLAKFSQ